MLLVATTTELLVGESREDLGQVNLIFHAVLPLTLQDSCATTQREYHVHNNLTICTGLISIPTCNYSMAKS